MPFSNVYGHKTWILSRSQARRPVPCPRDLGPGAVSLPLNNGRFGYPTLIRTRQCDIRRFSSARPRHRSDDQRRCYGRQNALPEWIRGIGDKHAVSDPPDAERLSIAKGQPAFVQDTRYLQPLRSSPLRCRIPLKVGFRLLLRRGGWAAACRSLGRGLEQAWNSGSGKRSVRLAVPCNSSEGVSIIGTVLGEGRVSENGAVDDYADVSMMSETV